MPPESPDNPTNLPPPPREPLPFIPSGSRYSDLETHELWQLLDDMEDERGKARRREAFYISTIIYMFVAWFAFYGPHVLWHQPHMINPADALKDRDLTYLDMPPDALKQMKPKAPKILSDKDRIEQTPDRKTLQHLKAEEPPPAPPPTQQQQSEQAALPPEPQPQQPPPMRPQQQDQSILEAPRPQQQQPKPNFNQPAQSAAEALKQLSENALPTRPGFHGNYSGNAVHHAGALGDVDVLSDTSGVDPDELQKYIQRLLYELRQTWIPRLPEETYPPLSKQGDTLISFTIAPDGHIVAMQLDGSTHDDAINIAAWGAIKGTPYAPLPKGMKDPDLSLRIRFMVNEPEE
jgi:outer membrane biosynthesis protein TonB